MEGNSIGSARENIYQPRLNMQSPFENSRLNRRGGAVCSKKLRGEGGGRGQSPFLGEKRNRVRGLEIHERPTKKPAFQKSSRKKNGLAYFEGGPGRLPSFSFHDCRRCLDFSSPHRWEETTETRWKFYFSTCGTSIYINWNGQLSVNLNSMDFGWNRVHFEIFTDPPIFCSWEDRWEER